MTSSIFCPACTLMGERLRAAKIIDVDEESSPIVSDFSGPRRCPSCGKAFSSMMPGNFEQAIDANDDSEYSTLPCYDESSSGPSIIDYDPDLLATETFGSFLTDQTNFSYGTNWNLNDQISCANNGQTHSVNVENVNFVSDNTTVIPDQEYEWGKDFSLYSAYNAVETDDYQTQEFNTQQSIMIPEHNDGTILGENESFLRQSPIGFTTDWISYTSEFDREAEEFSQILTTETQSNSQPQRETESDLITPHGEASTIESFLTEQSNGLDEVAENSMREKRSPIYQFRRKVRKSYENRKWIDSVYRLGTYERASVDEIQARIITNFYKDERDDQSYICKMEHGCRKVFADQKGIKEHIFSHFFTVRCKVCHAGIQYPRNFKRHYKTCKRPSENSTDQVTKSDVIEGQKDERKRKRKHVRFSKTINKFDKWTDPIYKSGTNEQVSIDEIQVKIAENYDIDETAARPFICLIKHNCSRFFRRNDYIKMHLFSHFFYFRCENCGTKLNNSDILYNHKTKMCKGAKSDEMISDHESSISEESDSSVESELENRASMSNTPFAISDGSIVGELKDEKLIGTQTVPNSDSNFQSNQQAN